MNTRQNPIELTKRVRTDILNPKYCKCDVPESGKTRFGARMLYCKCDVPECKAPYTAIILARINRDTMEITDIICPNCGYAKWAFKNTTDIKKWKKVCKTLK